MKAIHLDAVGGIAGDMFVAAMLDAFPELQERVLRDAAAALPNESGVPRIDEGMSGAVRAKRFTLHLPHAAEQGSDDLAHPHAHGYQGEALGHHADHHHLAHGSFPDMVRRVEAASLADGTARHAVAILTILAEAEAGIHGVSIDQVHFHEIADWDSLMDVVAAGSIAAALEGARWTVSALPRGGGLVKTQHGLLPVPAPATAAILTGFHWRDDGVTGERVTPTGAAILKHLAEPRAEAGEGRLSRTGTGAGTRELPGLPNILRVLAFKQAMQRTPDTVTVVSFEIDDMTGEEIGVAADRLRAVDGVLDVSLGERWGKKGRPMQSFALLVRPDRVDEVAARCFVETSTIGLRTHMVGRKVLDRSQLSRDGVAVKRVERPDGATIKAESDHLMGGSLAERRAAKQRAESIDHG
ncbi:MAG: LarC family nickel insertion protein [Mesorhizobium sp.]|uniref:LarC family nickel insertion protein n=1 Tax=Mesorhizobium sp. TaxID=1871066 RepID=UPI000FE6DEEA|nr:LarC family nickel insertion protein [Mesorhizobium sp.]RWH94075.1 MAG: LarC family nickel insertion protein [Mesorhizobium sp.]RWK82705.1 MAG: LarC family nickel insertion protein [Mesorhizobium sp.]RWL06512.1 MAG: LarC family nickel insertion protein [Mesorhizobium sp.]